jgi:hypothetical protein
MKKGLLIGINYIGTENQLNGCINDSLNLKKLLVTDHYFTESQLTMMSDRQPINNPLYPIRRNILDQIDRLVAFSKQKQHVDLFLAYSGHGSQRSDQNGDEEDGQDELLCPRDQNIDDDTLRTRLIDQLGDNVTLFILIDACHSGTMLDLKYTYLCDQQQNYHVHGKLSDTKCHVVVISGCLDQQTSADAYVKKTYQGALTAAFIDNYRPSISTNQLIEGIRKWMIVGKYSQIPQISSGRLINIEQPFILSKFLPTTELKTPDLLKHKVLSAFYGKHKHYIDVTQVVSRTTTGIVSNLLFGDPIPGKKKKLIVTLDDGTKHKFKENHAFTF